MAFSLQVAKLKLHKGTVVTNKNASMECQSRIAVKFEVYVLEYFLWIMFLP